MSCVATPAHASETFEWRIRQRSHARPAVQRGGSGGVLLYFNIEKGARLLSGHPFCFIFQINFSLAVGFS